MSESESEREREWARASETERERERERATDRDREVFAQKGCAALAERALKRSEGLIWEDAEHKGGTVSSSILLGILFQLRTN